MLAAVVYGVAWYSGGLSGVGCAFLLGHAVIASLALLGWLALTAQSVRWIGGVRGWAVGLAAQAVFLGLVFGMVATPIGFIGFAAAIVSMDLPLIRVWSGVFFGVLACWIGCRYMRRRFSRYCRQRYVIEASDRASEEVA